MGSIKGKRFRQALLFGWKDAGEISRYPDVTRSRISIFLDIWHCFSKYYLFSNQYKAKRFWAITDEERLDLAQKLGNSNLEKDKWIDIHYGDWKFLSKYTSISWQKSPKRIKKRNDAYARHYGLSSTISVQYGVTFICEHYSVGTIKCGDQVLFARNVDIDYTGDLTLGPHVALSEGVKVLTHAHDLFATKKGKGGDLRSCVLTPLVIQDFAWIGTKAIIHPGVKEIGRRAVIAANSNVKNKVPPYAIVMGNPAKVIGFVSTPKEIVEYEKVHYPESERIPLEILEHNYNKYFKSRVKEIKEFIKQ